MQLGIRSYWPSCQTRSHRSNRSRISFDMVGPPGTPTVISNSATVVFKTGAASKRMRPPTEAASPYREFLNATTHPALPRNLSISTASPLLLVLETSHEAKRQHNSPRDSISLLPFSLPARPAFASEPHR